MHHANSRKTVGVAGLLRVLNCWRSRLHHVLNKSESLALIGMPVRVVCFPVLGLRMFISSGFDFRRYILVVISSAILYHITGITCANGKLFSGKCRFEYNLLLGEILILIIRNLRWSIRHWIHWKQTSLIQQIGFLF